MTTLYRHQAQGYALLWPLVDLGRDAVSAAAYGGVGGAAIAKGALPLWAVRLDGAQRWRLPARDRRDALACVAELADRGAAEVALYQGARVRADGRILWAATDRFSTTPSAEILAPTGVILKAKLDPLRPADFKGLTRRAAEDLAAADVTAGLPAVHRFVDRVSDATRGNANEELRRAASVLRTEQRGLDRKWVEAADPHFKDITRSTRASVKDRFMGGVEIDISAPQVAAVQRLVEQQGWFVRGLDGQRNDALTARARKIVAAGLAQGLGRAELAADLRRELPEMWKGMGRGYAHTIAANGLARARSHAELSTYADGGIEYAEVVAMLDERTTDQCFLGNTKILTDTGEKAIELINPGDPVVTGFGFISSVLMRSKRSVDSIVRVRLSSGRQLYVTEEHPFLTRSGWLPAGSLCMGDVIATRHRLVRPAREIAQVVAEYKRRLHLLPDPFAELSPSVYLERCANVLVMEVDVLVGVYDVYNLQVQDDPTYVAETAVVHNCRLMDGQIIPIRGALDLANRAASVTTPEDIGRVAPFLRQSRNDAGATEIHAGKTLLGRFEREGAGRVDDRGRAQQFVAGDDFTGAHVGGPPYHHNCRTTLVPRMDIDQVPRGSAMRAVGPSPSENGDWASFGALEQFEMPTKSTPVVTGTMMALDDYALPGWKPVAPAVRTAVDSDPTLFALRPMGARPAGRAFDEAAPWGRVTQADAMKEPALLATANDAAVQVLHGGNPRQVLGVLLANPASVGRERLLELRDLKGRPVWARFTGRTTSAYAKAVEAVRLATTQAEIAKATEELVRIAEASGIVRLGKTVEDVALPKETRVTTRTSGLPARSPDASARATGAQPQAGTWPKTGPSPILEDPGPRHGGPMRTVAAGPELYAARPDGSAIASATWKNQRGAWSSTSVDVQGVPVERRAWSALASTHGATPQTALRAVRPGATDQVVNVTANRVLNPGRQQTRRYVVSALEAELTARHAVKRDWILTDHEGNALFLRVDGAALGKMKGGAFGRAANAWIRSGDASDLAKLGAELHTDVRTFYPNVRVNWQQRNLIPGVPIAEQVDRRLANVRDEIQTHIRAQEAQRKRALTPAEKGALIQRLVKEGAATVPASSVLVTRGTDATPAEVRATTARDRALAGVKGPMEVQTGSTRVRAINLAFADCSDALLQAVAGLGAPRLYRAPGQERALAIEHNTIYGRNADGTVIVMPRAYDKVLQGRTAQDQYFQSVLRHEAAHVYSLAGKTDVAARIARNRLARDVDDVRAGDVDVYGKGGKLKEVALPGRFMATYDGRVYAQDETRVRRLVGKKMRAKDFTAPDAVNPHDTRVGQEFLSTAVERLPDAEAMGRNWELAPDQVAFMISALRGHYVPH